MKHQIKFALNHITAPRLSSNDFINLAARLGCVGVELRNDLADKQLTTRAFFDGKNPSEIGSHARSKGTRLLGLSEVYAFNRWSEAIRAKVETLIGEALASKAETISLIPSNDGRVETDEARLSDLRFALSQILPLLKGAKLIALVEPLGFATSSLRHKQEALAAFAAVGGQAYYKLVHDTFHHHLAGETEFFPQATGIVHISGVLNPNLRVEQMRDEHRVLVTPEDRLENIFQITKLLASGYTGAFSYECFAPSVHSSESLEKDIEASFNYIRAAVDRS